MHSFTKYLFTLLLGVLIVTATVSAQSILGPGSAPPYTTGAPVTMDGEFQDKNGTFAAGGLHVDTAFCMGADCRTSWANAGAGTCQLETRRVDANQSPGFFMSGGTNSCFDFLTPAAKAAGWAPSGHDNCVNIGSRDCQRPSTCIFTRLACGGSITTDPTIHEGPLFFPVVGFTIGTDRQCSDTIDNDTDGLVDYPADPNCTSWNDNAEAVAAGGGGGRGWGGDRSF